jgi:RHS repeat-associated protein
MIRKDLGRLPNKARMENPNIVFAESQTLNYNIRGWWYDSKAYNKLDKTNIQSDGNVTAASPNFEHGLRYNLNGNIKSSNWEGNGGQDYSYDGYGRLVSAIGKVNSPTKFEETISYDVNGNIATLMRKNAGGFTIDDLKYNYKANSPNQLDYVNDVAVSVTTEDDEANQGFPKGMGNVADFTYDANGNLLNDTRRGISTTYNLLNLVNTVSFTGKTGNQSYRYAADGTKLSFTPLNGINKTYIGAVEYNNNGNVLRIGTEEGHVMLRPNWTENSKDSKYVYYYTIKDHLGNVRMVLDDDANANIWQKTDYNAFGLDAKNDYPQGTNAAKERNNHLYNDKESDPETTRLDYGARQYDNVLGRWFVVDPLAEKYFDWSPYNFTGNNPLKYIDPNGEDIIIYYKDAEGFDQQYIYEYGKEYNSKKGDKNFNQYVSDVINSFNYIVSKGADKLKDANGQEYSPIERISNDHDIKLGVTYLGENVNEFHASQGKDEFDSDYIKYDPYSGVENKDGSTQTPALGLFHELAHAYEFFKDYRQAIRDKANNPRSRALIKKEERQKKDIHTYGSYESFAEYNVIFNYERYAAKILGEGVRKTHDIFKILRTVSPTSVKK